MLSSRSTLLLVSLLLTSTLLLSGISRVSASTGIVFAKTWGGFRGEEGFSAAADANNSIYAAGYTGTFDNEEICGGGVECIRALLLKYNSSGGLVWARTWGSGGDQIAHAVAADPLGNIYLAGETGNVSSRTGVSTPDAFLLKFSSQGRLEWVRTIGGNGSDVALGIALDSNGHEYLTGYTNSIGAGVNNVFIAKFDSNGTLLWERTWGGEKWDVGGGIAIDLSGDIYVTGDTISFGPGGICGTMNCPAVFLLKFNATGGLLWQRIWGGGEGVDVVTDSSGSVYVTGTTSAVLLLKFDSSGNLLWSHTYRGKAADDGTGIVVDSSGEILIVGHDENSRGVLLLRLDSSGSILSQRTWGHDGGIGYDDGHGIALDSSGDHLVTGYVSEPGPYLLQSANLQIGSPTITVKTAGNSTLGTPSFPALNSSLPVASPVGNESYSGLRDLFLLKFGSLAAPTFGPVGLVLSAIFTTSILLIRRRLRR